ncbi:BLUF domain-containing protein [Methylobacterium sp. E-046]|uniref:BLUF domain-containing protein n=1 Tax=Methylobacterium sp. E-046 TaxID=2836576 RepID=UPI001FB9C60E|nr:BLUF domain-containing protein [Methylobacterium sp. E-046]MCJ2102431.1 BLUF domain-containing protein [Methylobacterium sp. E-046]
MSDLYRLVYASKNLIAGTEAEIAAAVTQILETSQRNNTKVGVTGALMFNAGAFAQVLEGPRRAVEETFERIQRDLRHSDVTVLEGGQTDSRGFANWSMAFAGRSAHGQARFSSLAAESGFDLARLSGDRVFAMLHELVMDEEGITGVEVTSAAVEARGTAALDVEQVRAEITNLRPNASVVPLTSVVSIQPAQAGENQGQRPEVAKDAYSSSREVTNAAICVLKAALVSERERTSELRTEIDALQIALASSEVGLEAMRAERDLWAKRARLLADAMAQEADELQDLRSDAGSSRAQQHEARRLGGAPQSVTAA